MAPARRFQYQRPTNSSMHKLKLKANYPNDGYRTDEDDGGVNYSNSYQPEPYYNNYNYNNYPHPDGGSGTGGGISNMNMGDAWYFDGQGEEQECQPKESRVLNVSSACNRPPSTLNNASMDRIECLPPTPLKRSMSFLTTRELFSYKAIPAVGVLAYLGTAVGTTAHSETFQALLGSEVLAINLTNCLTITSIMSVSCYMYGRRHIRHAGAFERVIYPLFTSTFFNFGSFICWSFLKWALKEQDVFDYHWRVLGGVFSGILFLYTGRSYLRFVDHW